MTAIAAFTVESVPFYIEVTHIGGICWDSNSRFANGRRPATEVYKGDVLVTQAWTHLTVAVLELRQ